MTFRLHVREDSHLFCSVCIVILDVRINHDREGQRGVYTVNIKGKIFSDLQFTLNLDFCLWMLQDGSDWVIWQGLSGDWIEYFGPLQHTQFNVLLRIYSLLCLFAALFSVQRSRLSLSMNESTSADEAFAKFISMIVYAAAKFTPGQTHIHIHGVA